jgi:hypothetical protein
VRPSNWAIQRCARAHFFTMAPDKTRRAMAMRRVWIRGSEINSSGTMARRVFPNHLGARTCGLIAHIPIGDETWRSISRLIGAIGMTLYRSVFVTIAAATELLAQSMTDTAKQF